MGKAGASGAVRKHSEVSHGSSPDQGHFPEQMRDRWERVFHPCSLDVRIDFAINCCGL